MRGWLPGLLLVAACYAPSIPSERPCSPGGLCPEGQMCNAARTCVSQAATLGPDAAVPVDGVVAGPDRDHDGIADMSDNCPDIANSDQFNEDGDRFGDACDPCPQISDDAPADSDGDHVGDACDPNSAAHDTFWLFEGFHMGMPAWPGSTHWTPSADKLQVTATGGTNDLDEYLVLPLTSPGRTTFDNFSVAVTILVRQQPAGSSNEHALGIGIYDSSVDKSVWCELDIRSDVPKGILMLVDDFNTGVDQEPAYQWMNNTVYRLTITRRGTSYTCSVLDPAGGGQTASGVSNIAPHDGGAVTIWAFGVVAEFGSVQVIGSP